MYRQVVELSYDYSEWSGYLGDAGKIEFEVSGTPGLASSIAFACEQWARANRLTIEAFAIYQDVEPLFDKYSVYMVFHDSPIVWAAILPLIPFLIKAITVLGVSFIAWRMSTVVFAPPKSVVDTGTVTAISELVGQLEMTDIPPDRKAEIIRVITKGAGSTVSGTDFIKYLPWIALGLGVLYLITILPKGNVGNLLPSKR